MAAGVDGGGGLTSPQTQAAFRRLLQSPLGAAAAASALPLGSNNDELERARARAARAASFRRKSLSVNPRLSSSAETGGDGDNDLLDRDQIMELFQNCIKLAAENKINQKNTWELGLIDHLSEIIRANAEDDNETNFQKASCTLEAGVKIYSLRVDSAHSEAYKVLGGINRAGHDSEHESSGEVDHLDSAQLGNAKGDSDKKMSPTSTLESSFESLNFKKFDVAFTVDPLYHQTSAQFDEGGAKGLLLYNLGVFGGCRVLFDSLEAPDKCTGTELQNSSSEIIDLSSLREEIEIMKSHIPLCKDLSPTLGEIIAQFDEEHSRPRIEADLPDVNDSEQCGHEYYDNEPHDSTVPDWGACVFDDSGDHESTVDDNSTFENQSSVPCEAFGGNSFDGPCADEKFEKIADFLSLSLGFRSNNNAWAGPDHWKFHKIKDSNTSTVSYAESEAGAKKAKSKKLAPDVEFSKEFANRRPNIFAPPKNPKSLLVSSVKTSCNNKLPEDCHYKLENLVNLLILPEIMCLGKKLKKQSDETLEDDRRINSSASWDDESSFNDFIHDANDCSDIEDQGSLIRQPRQVNKIEIQYDKVSKQVDVHALKDMLWNHIQDFACSVEVVEEQTASVPLTRVIHHFPMEGSAASNNEISPHLYFICLLHLANEHCLTLRDCATLDEVEICVPSLPVK